LSLISFLDQEASDSNSSITSSAEGGKRSRFDLRDSIKFAAKKLIENNPQCILAEDWVLATRSLLNYSLRQNLHYPLTLYI
jgi:hypothetical protein